MRKLSLVLAAFMLAVTLASTVMAATSATYIITNGYRYGGTFNGPATNAKSVRLAFANTTNLSWTMLRNVDGCGLATIEFTPGDPGILTLTWPAPCVTPFKDFIIQLSSTSNDSLHYTGGYWTEADGVTTVPLREEYCVVKLWDKGFITIDSAQGALAGDTVLTGSNLRFVLRYKLDTTTNIGISSGFRIYSPDGATWDSTAIDTLGWRPGDATPGKAIVGKAQFELSFSFNPFHLYGKGCDTVGVLGLTMATTGKGLIGPFNDTAFSVTAYKISSASAGKTICIDSSMYRPSNTWKWSRTGGFTRFPRWYYFPKCYSIKAKGLAVEEIGDGNLPRVFALTQNYPNPFNPTTNINFDVPVNSQVTLTIFNVLGQKVKTLVDKEMAANKYKVDWDGTSDAGVRVSSGVYFYRMQAGDFTQTKKMMLIK